MVKWQPKKPKNVIKIPDFEPRAYQLDFLKAMDEGYKRAVLIWHRRAGKEVTCWNYLIREACCGRTGTYVYFFPTSRLGRRILWDGSNKDGRRFIDYIPSQLIDGQPNSVEMRVTLKNGSVIQIMGTDQIINVGINPIGCVFSEYSLQDPKTWNFVRPILRENEGWAVFNFCVKRGTLVLTEQGLRPIESITEPTGSFTEIDKNIYGLGGFHKAEQFYSGGKKHLIKLKTAKGYEIECTPNHPLWDGQEWKEAATWKTGDHLPIQLNQQIFSKNDFDFSKWKPPIPKSKQGGWKSLPKEWLPLEIMYLMGLYLAEGSMASPKKARGAQITITNTDPQIVEYLQSMGFKTQKDGIHHIYSGGEVQNLFEWFGLSGTAKQKRLPLKLFECSKPQIVEFLKGYFDGDGCASSKTSGQVKATSSSKELLKSLQVLLLIFGIVSRLSSRTTPPTKRVTVPCEISNLEIEGYFAWKFFEEIGFRLSRKQRKKEGLSEKIKQGRGDLVPTDAKQIGWYPRAILANPSSISYRMLRRLNDMRPNLYIQNLLSDAFYWDKIVDIEQSEGEVYDFVIPETHSFFSNGIISHNTPRGRNHAYDMFLMAEDNPDWFCQRLTIDDTGVLTEKDMEIERMEGMSEHLIQQEYFCNFDQGQEGSYYAKYLNKAEMQGRITSVPYDPYCPVDTYWDIGVSDSTAIIFAQTVGQEIHIIDHYEAQGEGLNHYARILRKKEENNTWQYGTHYAPHDIKVRELGHGAKTRIDMARELGINFEVVPNLPIQEGIELARGIFHRLWIDSKQCKYLIKCIENYHKHFNERLNVYSDKPVHDWSSHSCDAFRYLAVAYHRAKRDRMTEEDAELLQAQYAHRY